MAERMRRLRELVMRFIYPHDVACSICSSEVDVSPGYGVCAICMATLPRVRGEMEISRGRAFDALAAPFYYETPVKELIHRFKYSNKRFIAKGLAHFMHDAVKDAGFTRIHAIVPVPLHEARRRERGFNQAALLASELVGLMETVMDENIIRRIRDTRTQTLLDKEEREQNMKDAFEVPETSRIEGATLLLVDDVVTTGTTADACARTLKAAGAKMVYVVSACTRAIE